VYRVSFPRNDVAVKVEGRSMHPFLGLTSWAAFTPHSNNQLMVLGDLVLFEDEVNPAMSAALDNGLEVTALHDHFFFDTPRVMFMHIGGTGSAERLATAVRRTLDKVKEIRASNAQPAGKFEGAAIPDRNSITAAPLDTILDVKGQVNAGMYKAIGRKAAMHGHSVGNQMEVNTWAAFAGTDNAAPVDGDFVMLESELRGRHSQSHDPRRASVRFSPLLGQGAGGCISQSPEVGACFDRSASAVVGLGSTLTGADGYVRNRLRALRETRSSKDRRRCRRLSRGSTGCSAVDETGSFRSRRR